MDLEAVRKKVEAALADRRRRVVDSESLIPAAVLLLLTNRRGPHVVFAKRTEDVTHHKGQFSFPGGIVETCDGSRLETALREAQDDIGQPPSAVDILGTLDDTETRATQFVITPFVGMISQPVSYTPDGKEIERVLEVPLEALLDPANVRVEMWERDGEIHPVYFYEYNGETIWGATARILKQFLDLVFPEGAPR
mgnify:FL=1